MMTARTESELRQSGVGELLIACREAANERIARGRVQIIDHVSKHKQVIDFAERAFVSSINGYDDLFVLDSQGHIHKYNMIELRGPAE